MNQESTPPEAIRRSVQTFGGPALAGQRQIGEPSEPRTGPERPDAAAMEEALGHRAVGDWAAHRRRPRSRKPSTAPRAAPGGAAARHSKKNLGHPLGTTRERFERIRAM